MNRRAGGPSIARRLPLFYGWIVVACAMCASFARQGAAVATLSVFIAPMVAEFGWSRAGLSGAVSLGGVLGALSAPILGPLVDRNGARVLLTVAAVVIAGAALALSATESLPWFYVAFGIGRMTFAGPFDLGISAAVANWFVRWRARAMSYVAVATGASLAIMPLMAQLVIDGHGWRMGWIAIAIAVLVVGALPVALLMRRRPEDVGLLPDGATPNAPATRDAASASTAEAHYTLRDALRTRAMWMLMGYTALIFPVQAGVSLHQAPHLVERGLSPTVAATVVSTFSLSAALCSLGFGVLGSRWPVHRGLATAAASMAAGVAVMYAISTPLEGYVGAALFGAGIGGLLTLLPVAFADYFGRASFGAIRGAALPVQVIAQAAGPLIAGLMHDAGGSYDASLATFFVLATLAAALALAAGPPPSRRKLS